MLAGECPVDQVIADFLDHRIGIDPTDQSGRECMVYHFGSVLLSLVEIPFPHVDPCRKSLDGIIVHVP